MKLHIDLEYFVLSNWLAALMYLQPANAFSRTVDVSLVVLVDAFPYSESNS